jgi:uncharacterized protein DUF4190
MSVATPGQPQSASTQAILSLVLGILSIVTCCGILGPIAWYLGSQEQKAIREGRAPAAGEGIAKAGLILGIIGTICMVMWILWIFLWGGMAALSTMMNQ